MSKIRSFKDYIDSRFDSEIFEALDVFIDSNKNSMSRYSHRVDRVDETELCDIEIKSVSVDNDKEWRIKFDIVVVATILLKGHHHSDEQIHIYYKLISKENLREFQVSRLKSSP